MEKQEIEMKWKLKMETELETEMGSNLLAVTCCSPSKIHALLAFIPT